MPTSRNAKGIDILGYDQTGKRTITVQVKALSKRNPVPLGAEPKNLIAKFIIIARHVAAETPEFFIARTSDIRDRIHEAHKDGKTSYWLQPKDYEGFRDQWATIGNG